MLAAFSKMKIDKSTLGVAGEFAVAAELCRRNIYAQLTLGHQKRIDLLIVSPDGEMLRIEVKAKQGREWPNCKGIYGTNTFIVFVDYHNKPPTERPDFYVLTVEDWIAHVESTIARYTEKHPHRRAEMNKTNCLVLPDEVNKYGKPYKGCGVKPRPVHEHHEAWWKIIKNLDDE